MALLCLLAWRGGAPTYAEDEAIARTCTFVQYDDRQAFPMRLREIDETDVLPDRWR